MQPIRYLLTLWCISQNAPPSTPPKPVEAAKPAAAAATKSGETPKSAQPAAAGAATPAKPADDPDSDVDKFLRGEADRLDKLVDVSADFVQTIRFQDQEIQTTGVYKSGAKRKLRFDIKHVHGGVSGRQMFICNGTVGYHVIEYGATSNVEMYKIDEIAPLMEGKDVTAEERNAIATAFRLPFVYPSQMLRGFLARLTFTKKEDAKLGGRDVVKLEGRWRKATVAMMLGKADGTVDDIGGDFPQYVTLQIDKQTGWPLQLEQFRREKDLGVFKPVYTLRFTKIAVGTPAPEADFTYVPPQKPESLRDLTAEIKERLTTFRDQKAKAAKNPPTTAPKPAPTGAAPTK